MKWFNLEDSVNSLSILGAIAIVLLTLIVVGRLFKLMKVKKEELVMNFLKQDLENKL